MQKYDHSFGKNDIRGIYGGDITEELFYNIGIGYITWLTKQNGKQAKDLKISVCMDARLHSPSLKLALINGLKEIGVGYIEDLGLAPTPIGYYSEVAHKLDGAMIITASHNPSEYNGMKMTYNRQTLNEKQIKEVKELTYENWKNLPANLTEYHFETEILPEYISEMKEKFGEIGKNIKVVVDSANATGGIVGPQLYRELGCEVVELFSEPDGRFPNHHPNPSVLSTLETLSKTVLETGADFGIAFDGDSDRIGVVDSQGKPLTGDKLLLIYAMDMIETKPIVVSEVKCSQVLYDTINEAGGTAIMCKTGHGYIKEKMKETNAILGGEMSGHTFFKDRYYGFDDAIYAGCRMIEIVAKNKAQNSNFKLEELLAPFNKVFTSDEVRFPCPNELKKVVLETMQTEVQNNPEMFGSEIKEIITLDGMRIVFKGGFAMIRQSNTEPVFTLRFEANNELACNRYKNVMTSFLDECVTAMSK
ncbi:phosphomannomutase/phosphoglucomutase [bacterium]|nr:phosphomannomutase/phosphoglucomutase [bacterium]MBO5447562.1 phosphomannomutase/phosphoglucomutase [bacterium]